MKKLLITSIAILGIVHHGFAFDTGSDEAAIPISSVPYTINSPGIYYLAKNIFTNANAKITISASSVVLDLGGHTLQVSSTDECIFVKGTVGGPPVTNVTIQNGALVNNVAGCIFLNFTNGCVIDHVSATAAGQCTLFDEGGANNRISNCIFASGKPASPQGPFGKNGPAPCTVFLEGCSDLVENNIITSAESGAVESANTGGVGLATNALRNNVVRTPLFGAPSPSVVLDGFNDVYIGNLFPGKPAGANNVTGGVRATE
jgi:hypothetical protein